MSEGITTEDHVTGLVVWKTLLARVLLQKCFKNYTLQPNMIDYKGSAFWLC